MKGFDKMRIIGEVILETAVSLNIVYEGVYTHLPELASL
jgi:hypothetical protein